MTAKNTPVVGLAAKLADDAAAAAAAANLKAQKTMALALAYDAHGYTGPAPYIISANEKPAYDGDMGTMHFRDVGPDQFAALLAAFPPVPRFEYRSRGCRSFRPAPLPDDAEDVRECDGLEITYTSQHSAGEMRAAWSAMVGDLQVGIWANVKRVHFLHPTTYRRSVNYGHNFVRFEGPTETRWPDKGALFHAVDAQGAGLFIRQYAPISDQYHGDAHIRGDDVVALVRAWEAECNRRGELTRAAYEADAVAVRALGLPSADDIAAQCERMRAEYEAKRGGLRAGTLAQTAALETPHALADKALAEKHWPTYAAAHGIKTGQTWFEHYAWACDWLRRCGLYEVPVTDEMRASATGGIAADVQTYKYGARWL